MNSAIRAAINSSRVVKFQQSGKVFQQVLFRSCSSATDRFEAAKNKLKELKEDPGQDVQLKIYGLFKQASSGAPTGKRPGALDFVGRAKYDAWAVNKDMSQDDAKTAYADLVDKLHKEQVSEEPSTSESGQTYKHLLVEMDGGLRKIILNRPKKKNAITTDMYDEWADALREATEDKQTVITAITGAGDYYCSGNDLSNFTNVTPETIPKMAQDSSVLLNRFVSAFIDFPKPLVAVVNGPAVGISVTTLGLFDAVYSTDRATFHTPFSSLGQSPEGCSSYIFPKIMGYGMASEMLYFNKKITAGEAKKCGLVTELFPDDSLQSEIWPRLRELAKLPVNSIVYSKELVRALEKENLHKVNDMECARLVERWQSDDCKKAIMAFFSRNK